MCVSGYMLPKIRVGRSDYFFYILKYFYLLEVLFIKTELVYLHFSVCHVVSRFVAPSVLSANSLISADVLSAARERCKNTFSKVSFNISCNKNRLETENIFLRELSVVKTQNDNKKLRVGDLNLGTVGDRKQTYIFVGLS